MTLIRPIFAVLFLIALLPERCVSQDTVLWAEDFEDTDAVFDDWR